MGTDIHPVVQVRTAGGWEDVGQGPTDDDAAYARPVLCHRNYALFAILAGVRNGFGFAGCLLGSPLRPIAAPRGLPDDCGALPGGADFGEHSFSWVTLRELDRYPWDEARVCYGVIPAAAYDGWLAGNADRSRPPTSWCGGVMGPNIVQLTEADFLDARAHDALPPPPTQLHVQVSWTQPHRALCAPFYDMVLPWLHQLAAANSLDHDDVRIVFGFDS